SLFLEEPRVGLEGDRVQPAVDGGRVEPGRPPTHRLLDGAEELSDRREVVSRCGANVHDTSESRCSANPSRLWSSTSGWGSGSSPSRLIQMLRSPSPAAGAMSWKRLAPTWT